MSTPLRMLRLACIAVACATGCNIAGNGVGYACNDATACAPGEYCAEGQCVAAEGAICTGNTCQCPANQILCGTVCVTAESCTIDGGFDAGPSVTDAGHDAGTTPDAGYDAGQTPDAGYDAGQMPDAGYDAGLPDGGFDAGPRLDGGGPDAGGPGDAGHPDAGASCVNSTSCQSGYVCISGQCQPSACRTDNGGCSVDATCTPDPTTGQANCACNSGYVGSGQTCAECPMCDSNATCSLGMSGMALCSCNSGYIGNGEMCTPAVTGVTVTESSGIDGGTMSLPDGGTVLTLTVGQSVQLAATASYANGTGGDVTSSATWSSTNTISATVSSGCTESSTCSQNGTVTALAVGGATISATFQQIGNGGTQTQTGSIQINVVAPVLDSVTVNALEGDGGLLGPPPTLTVGQSAQLVATANYSNNTSQSVTTSATWITSNAAIATVSVIGSVAVVNAIGPGSVTIAAVVGVGGPDGGPDAGGGLDAGGAAAMCASKNSDCGLAPITVLTICQTDNGGCEQGSTCRLEGDGGIACICNAYGTDGGGCVLGACGFYPGVDQVVCPSNSICNLNGYCVTPEYSADGGVVEDEQTGLLWQENITLQCPWEDYPDGGGPGCDFAGVEEYCSNLGSGWVVPTIDQLFTLVGGSFSPVAFLWSSTPVAGSPGEVWSIVPGYVYIDAEDVTGYGNDYGDAARCLQSCSICTCSDMTCPLDALGDCDNGTNCTGGAACQDLSNGLIAYFTFDDGNTDWSGNGNTINPSNVSLSPGKIGNGYQFTNDNSEISITDGTFPMPLNGARTMCAWVLPQSSEASGHGFPVFSGGASGAGDNYGLSPTDGVTSGCGGSTLPSALYLDDWSRQCTESTGAAAQPEAWSYVCWAYDGSSTETFYSNGKSSTLPALNYDFDLDTVVIGGNLIGGSTTQGAFYGIIDEVGIWSRALSTQEMAEGYANGIGCRPPP